MTGPGTLERIAALLGAALEPLGAELADPGQLLARLGVAIDDDLLDPGTAAAVAAAAAELATLTAALDVSITAGDEIGSAVAGARVAAKVGTVLTGLAGLGSAVSGVLAGAAAVSPAQRARADALLADLPGRLLSMLTVDVLRARLPMLTGVLAAVGVIEHGVDPGDDTDPMFPPHTALTLHWDRLGRLLTDPLSVPRDAYGFGAPGFDGTVLLGMLADLFSDRYERATLRTGSDGIGAVLQAPTFVLAVRGDELVFPQRLGVAGAISHEVPLSDAVTVTVRLAGNVAAGSELRLSPALRVSVVPPAGTADLTATVTLTAGTVGTPVTVLGLTGVGGLSVETVSVTGGLTAGWDPGANAAVADLGLGLSVGGGRFALDLSAAGGLVRALLPAGGLTAAFDLGLDLVGGTVTLRGGVALAASFPVHLSIGPLDVEAVTVGLSPAAIELSAGVRVTLGPLQVMLDRIGITATLTAPAGGGNLGPLAFAAAFKPPTGIGLVLDAGPVRGGGYLAVDGPRYAGVLQVKLSFLAITAYGIVEEVPGGGMSFVAVLGIRFLPGIQLGFGFAITGVGGLVGMNRRANVDLLRERLATGAAGNVLFCDDPVANAPTLLGDLAAFFPPAPGSFIVGPTLQIGWLAPIVRLDVAVLIELPGPSKIIILGSVRVLIGANETFALLYLRMDFLGVLDFENKLVSLDAYLVNSHALGVFRLTGGMAFRLSYGANPYVLLSIGGFHPRFDPGPLNVPAIPRVGAVLQSDLVVQIYLRLEMYVAFTANTLQLGAKVEAGIELGPIAAHGYLQFDALIQFRPFRFDIEFSAGFSVEVSGVSLCSVDVHGQLTGPGPLVVHAQASVKLLFVRVRGSATVELGGHDGDAPQPVPSLVRALEPELSRIENLRTEGSDPGVVLRPGPPAAGLLVSPLGRLVWEQKRVPLGTLVDRFEGAPLAGPHELALGTGSWARTDERDWFSPGTFTALDLKSSQTMNNAAFQELPSGVRLGAGGDRVAPGPVSYTPVIDLLTRPERTRFADRVTASYLTGALAEMLAERDTTPAVRSGPPTVVVAAETYDLVSATGTTITATTPFQAFQLSRLEPGTIAVPTSDAVLVDL